MFESQKRNKQKTGKYLPDLKSKWLGNLTRTEEHVVFKDDKDIKEKRLTNFDEVGLALEDRMEKRTRKR